MADVAERAPDALERYAHRGLRIRSRAPGSSCADESAFRPAQSNHGGHVRSDASKLTQWQILSWIIQKYRQPFPRTPKWERDFPSKNTHRLSLCGTPERLNSKTQLRAGSLLGFCAGRGGRDRTCDPSLPKRVRYRCATPRRKISLSKKIQKFRKIFCAVLTTSVSHSGREDKDKQCDLALVALVVRRLGSAALSATWPLTPSHSGSEDRYKQLTPFTFRSTLIPASTNQTSTHSRIALKEET